MASLTHEDRDRIADHLNDRPRKRLGFLTPKESMKKENQKGERCTSKLNSSTT
jgi:IS30 family transposase